MSPDIIVFKKSNPRGALKIREIKTVKSRPYKAVVQMLCHKKCLFGLHGLLKQSISLCVV